MTKLDEAIELCGGQSALASKLDLTSMAITQWKERGVPLKRALEIENLTNGQVKASDLCSELKTIAAA